MQRICGERFRWRATLKLFHLQKRRGWSLNAYFTLAMLRSREETATLGSLISSCLLSSDSVRFPNLEKSSPNFKGRFRTTVMTFLPRPVSAQSVQHWQPITPLQLGKARKKRADPAALISYNTHPAACRNRSTLLLPRQAVLIT